MILEQPWRSPPDPEDYADAWAPQSKKMLVIAWWIFPSLQIGDSLFFAEGFSRFLTQGFPVFSGRIPCIRVTKIMPIRFIIYFNSYYR
jgi:hypothetical protein